MSLKMGAGGDRVEGAARNAEMAPRMSRPALVALMSLASGIQGRRVTWHLDCYGIGEPPHRILKLAAADHNPTQYDRPQD